jgi:C1A family cysteine protease
MDTPKKHSYNWIPDIPDKRDLLYQAAKIPKISMPKSVDLRPNCSKVEDQGDLGSCTANASVAALEYLENVNKKDIYEDLSRLFVYYCTRKLQNTIKYDSGASLRTTIKALVKYGACPEDVYPYDIMKFKTKPPEQCFYVANDHKVMQYMRLSTLRDMKICLASGYPFVFGFSVYESFESDDVANTGIAQLPTKNDSLLGGHAVLGVGYDDVTQRFLIRNSWGEDWGNNGYFTLPYDYLADRDLSDDFWVIKLASGI